MTATGTDPLRARAHDAVAVAQRDPDRGRREATAIAGLAGARAAGPDRVALALAEQALGLADRAQGRIGPAVAHLEAGVRLATRAGEQRQAALIRLSLAAAYSYQGSTRASLRVLDEAVPDLSGLDAAVLMAQRAGVLSRLGRFGDAEEAYALALPVLRRHGDVLHTARLLNNRGLVFAYRDDFRRAHRDLAEAERLWVALGDDSSAATACFNRAFLAARQGDIPAALALYDRAADMLDERSVQVGPLARGRCETLINAGLLSDARALAGETARLLRANQMQADLTELLLLESHAAVLDGEPAEALAAAREALELALRQRRPGWVGLARYALVRARSATGDHSPAALTSARRAAADLERMGLTQAAADARIIAGRMALEAGNRRSARDQFARAAAGRRGGTAGVRVRAWYAEALLRLSRDDRRGADAALRRALDVVEQQRAGLGASELRTHLSTHASEIAALGMQGALGEAKPAQVLAWMERGRANALHFRPVRPPDDAVLATELAQLRRADGDLREAAVSGGDVARARRRQHELELAIRRRVLRTRPAGGTRAGRQGRPRSPTIPSVSELGSLLGDRALVELAAVDGVLRAIVVAGATASLHTLGEVGVATGELAQLRFALRRLGHDRGPSAARRAATASLRASAAALDAQLIRPLQPVLGERDLVVVPTGALHALPWSLLPSCAGRAVSVAPSARLWWVAATRSKARPGPTLLVAGPGLPHAAREVADLGRRYPDALRLTGEAATAAAVGRGLSRASLAHVAAHGTFRADNPLFSSLLVVDGPLTVYDLERLRRTPRRLILSSCQSGLSDVRPGDELMGLAVTLFSLGTTTLVASVVAVPDESTRPLMLALHRHLAAGAQPAAALAAAQRATADIVAAAGFVCFGYG